MLLTLLTLLYPVRKTYECLKKPVKGATKHWCIFWILFGCIQVLDPLLSMVPFWWLLKLITLVSNYYPTVTELTYKGTVGFCKTVQTRLNNDLSLQDRCDELAKHYIIPVLNHVQYDWIVKLPTPAKLVLDNFVNIIRGILITTSQPSQPSSSTSSSGSDSE